MGAGNHEHVVALGQLPCEHHTLVAHATGFGHLAERIEQVLVVRVTVAAQRTPAHERQTLLGAIVKRILGVQMNRRILVLHGHKLVAEDLLRDLQLFDAHVGNTRPLGHALIEQRLDAFAGLVVRHFRIMTVQVQQIDAVNAKRHRGLLAVFDQMLRLAVTRPNRLVTLPSAAQAHLGGHGDFLTRALPRVKRLTHQLFAGLFLFARRVVRPSGVDVTASGIQRGVQCFDTDIVTTIVFNGQRHFTMADGRGAERSKITEQSHPDLLQQHNNASNATLPVAPINSPTAKPISRYRSYKSSMPMSFTLGS